ncbi:MAG TPA: DUF4431 domain-containing protein [Chitinophagales bacterium]|nr:DUF4431 domain-containing protein [Chitinophagales bacterium]
MIRTIYFLLLIAVALSACQNKPVPVKELPPLPVEDTITTFQYSPAVSVLHGTLYMAAYEGAPEYSHEEELNAEDTVGLNVEMQYVLLLDKPINVLAPKIDESGGFNLPQTDVRKIQLVPAIDAQQYLNRKVKITGKLWGAQTAHHHTPVLISVDNIDAE